MTEISIFVNSCKILLCFDMRLFHMVMCLDFVVILLGAISYPKSWDLKSVIKKTKFIHHVARIYVW